MIRELRKPAGAYTLWHSTSLCDRSGSEEGRNTGGEPA